MDKIEFKKRFEKKRVNEKPNSVASKPIVSICVQTFQHDKFIKTCLDGILMQKTDFEFEILLGEDASTDGTREICIEYAEKFPEKIRLFLHHRENNIVINGSPTGRYIFMTNLYCARGKYIALCEGDDYWTDPNKLQKQVDFLEANPEFNLVGHYSHSLNVNLGEKILIGKHAQDRYSHEEIAYRNLRIPTSSLAFRNNLVFPDWIFKVYGGDRALIYLNSLKGDLKILDFIGSVYRVHDRGVEQVYKKDKLSLPRRNIKEDYLYYHLSSSASIKWKLFKKIVWNQFYYSFWSIRGGQLKQSFQSLFSMLKFISIQKL